MFDLKNKEPDSQIESQVIKGEKHIGKMRIKKGHKLFEINKSTHEVKPATFESVTVNFATGETRKKLIVTPGMMYIPALNEKNALLKFYKVK